MPQIKIYNYDREEMITYSFKTVKVKGVKIDIITPEDDVIHVYGKVLEVNVKTQN